MKISSQNTRYTVHIFLNMYIWPSKSHIKFCLQHFVLEYYVVGIEIFVCKMNTVVESHLYYIC